MSDAGDEFSINGVVLTFRDSASSFLPGGVAIVSGTYRPTNYVDGDTFVAPAPAGPYTPPIPSLAVFNGTPPNGSWRLFITDDAGQDFGSINNGWTLTLDTEVDTDGDGVVDVDDNCPFAPNPNQADTDSDGIGDACDTPPNQPPVVSNPGNRTGVVGTNANLAIIASDPDGGTLNYGAGNLPAGLSINTGTGVITGTFSAPGTSGVTVSVSDGQGGITTIGFLWTVTPAPLPDTDGDGVPNATDNCPTVSNSRGPL